MATLKIEHKEYIINELASFKYPTEVIESARKNFGVDISRQQVQYYNPDRNNKLAERWRDLFYERRDQFISEAKNVAGFNKVVRLTRLEKLYIDWEQKFDAAMDKDNYGLARMASEEMRSLLEMMAKDSSDSYGQSATLINTQQANFYEIVNQKIAEVSGF